jgi:hypothetical protein
MESGLYSVKEESKPIQFFMMEDYGERAHSESDLSESVYLPNVDDSILISGNHIVSVVKPRENISIKTTQSHSLPDSLTIKNTVKPPKNPFIRNECEKHKQEIQEVKLSVTEECNKMKGVILDQIQDRYLVLKQNTEDQIDSLNKQLQLAKIEMESMQKTFDTDIKYLKKELEETRRTLFKLSEDNTLLKKELYDKDTKDIQSLNRHLRMKEPTRFLPAHSSFLFSPLITPKTISMTRGTSPN